MLKFISKSLDSISGFLAPRKGLLPILGIGLIILNFFFRIFGTGWIVDTDIFLHLGIIVALVGIILGWAL
jgi:hypothetical protein